MIMLNYKLPTEIYVTFMISGLRKFLALDRLVLSSKEEIKRQALRLLLR